MGHLPYIPSTSSSLRTELLGTFLLVLIGTSALTALNVAGQATTASAILVSTLAFAAAVGWLTYTFYRFPLPQFNPAVTILFWIQGVQPLSRSALVIAMQLVGAVAASVVVALLYGSAGVEVRLGAPYPATAMGSWAALIAEFLGSIIMLYAIQNAMNRQRLAFFNPFLLISLGYTLGYLLSTGISGGSLNPARALAPQLAAADLTGWWAYILGPLTAAVGLGLLSRRGSLSLSPETRVPLPEQKPGVGSNWPATEPQVAVQSKAPEQTQPEIEGDTAEQGPSSSQPTLQQKAHDAVEKLNKDTPERPHLPFALHKPAFYPLAGNPKEDRSADEGSSLQTVAQTETAPPPATPKTNDAPTTSKSSVKFVNYEHPSGDSEEE